jgi:hypothetical protein
MRLSNPVPKISLLTFGAIALYLLAISGQPRMSDGGLDGDEMFWYEKLLSTLPAISLFATLGLGIWRAYRARSWTWVVAQLFLFPITYWYTLRVNRGADSQNPTMSERGVGV